MRALTLHQPWAWAICFADKTVENRPVAPPVALIGQDFAVHAGLTVDVQAHADFRAGVYGDLARAVPDVAELARGAVIGVALLEGYLRGTVYDQRSWPDRDAVTDCRWLAGPVGNLLSHRRPLRVPVAARGMQGWWPLPSEVEAEVRRQLGGGL